MKRSNVLHQLQTVRDPLDGMSYVIECDNGALLVIDGSMNGDAPVLLEYLKNLSGGEKPVVDAWFITHPHADHTFCFMEMARKYADQITVKKLIYHFADFHFNDTIQPVVNKEIAELESLADRFEGLERVHPITGDHFEFGSVKIDILFTWLDLPPVDGYDGRMDINDSSLVFRLTVDGQKILFLGDTEVAANRVMIPRYGKELKSDVVQVAHHGFVSSTEEFYRLIDPQILLWPASHDTLWYWAMTLNPVSRTLVSDMNVKEIHLQGNGTVVLPMPIQLSDDPYMIKVPPVEKSSEPELFIAKADVLPDISNPADPAWDKAEPYSLVETLKNATEAACAVSMLWTEDAFWFRASYKKAVLPSEPAATKTGNTNCVRLFLMETPVMKYAETWLPYKGKPGVIDYLKFFHEKKQFGDTMCDCNMPELCEYSVNTTDEGYVVCARVPFVEAKKQGEDIAVTFEVSGVDAPGKKRSTALLMEKEEGYCRCGSQPAALLIARLN